MGKLIIELTLEELMKDSNIDLYDMYDRDDFVDYLKNTTNWDYFYMSELDDILAYESPSQVAHMICASHDFDINDEIFYLDDYAGIHSMTITEYDKKIASVLDYNDFLNWAVWGGPGDERYLDALIREYGEKHFGSKADEIELRVGLD